MSKQRRVVVTGLGVVSCYGSDVNTFYSSLLEGKSGIGPMTSFDCSEYPTRFAGQVKDFSTDGYLDKKQARRVDPFLAYTVVAGKKAFDDANLDLDSLDKERCGILISSGMGGMTVFQDGCKTLAKKGFKRISPFFVPYIITNMGSALLSFDLGFQGPNYSISTACATGTYSIIAAAQHIERGDADLMLCGGVEAPLNPVGVAGFVVIKAISTNNEEPTKASRPWDKDRNGFVLGEGAGVLVLEELEHAKARGATIYAEYLGGAYSADAHHMTEPHADGSGVALCMSKAIKDAGINPTDVDYINAHATSTPVGDLCEVRAIKKTFGEHAKNLKINATKSLIGHCLGAAGGIEAIATVKAIQTGKLHPTINCDNPEEEIHDLDIVANKAQDHKVDVAISNSFGFGGHNAAVVFGSYNG